MVYNRYYMASHMFIGLGRCGIGMDCKEAEKTIPLFLQDDLGESRLEEFVEHIDGCSECKEELTIQFLVVEGMERLERGSNFNLQKALYTKLETARHRIRVHRMLQYTLACLEAAVAAAIAIAFFLVFRF